MSNTKRIVCLYRCLYWVVLVLHSILISAAARANPCEAEISELSREEAAAGERISDKEFLIQLQLSGAVRDDWSSDEFRAAIRSGEEDIENYRSGRWGAPGKYDRMKIAKSKMQNCILEDFRITKFGGNTTIGQSPSEVHRNGSVVGSTGRASSGSLDMSGSSSQKPTADGRKIGEASNAGFLYDDLNHTKCIDQRKNGESKKSYLLVNTCSEDLYVTFCTEDETNAGGMTSCPSLGSASIRANEEHVVRLWNDVGKIRVYKFACKEGWSPVEKGTDRHIYYDESGTFRCRKLK